MFGLMKVSTHKAVVAQADARIQSLCSKILRLEDQVEKATTSVMENVRKTREVRAEYDGFIARTATRIDEREAEIARLQVRLAEATAPSLVSETGISEQSAAKKSSAPSKAKAAPRKRKPTPKKAA